MTMKLTFENFYLEAEGSVPELRVSELRGLVLRGLAFGIEDWDELRFSEGVAQRAVVVELSVLDLRVCELGGLGVRIEGWAELRYSDGVAQRTFILRLVSLLIACMSSWPISNRCDAALCER